MTDDALVVFTPSGRRGRARLGTTVLETARALGVDIDSVCGTRGICGRCQVVQSVGDFAKHGITSVPGNLSDLGAKEVAYAERRGLADGRRLACTAEILGDLVIDVPAESQVHRQVVRKSLDLRRFRVDPVVKLHYVEVPQPDLASPTGDVARLLEALASEWGLRDLSVDLEVVRGLQKTLRAGSWGVTVAVHDGRDVIAAWPGLHEAVYGVAVDVGSTTIAGHLANLGTGAVLASAGLMNPQIRFGEDLMSRVSYAMLNDGGAAEMTKAVRGALDELVDRLVEGAGVERGDVLELTLVGNPIMHHLFLGIDPVELGSAPFALATDGPVRTTAAALGLGGLRPGARAYVLPCIAGHVGADTAGVILSDEPHLADPIRLLVDVGTNAEIVLGNRHRLLAASSPTGPAFEGAQISCGQRAAPGAIERVRVDPVSLEPRFKVIGCTLWSDEAGFAAATADLGITGICGSGIIEAMAELFLAGVITTDGVINGALAARTPRIVPEGRTFSYLLHDGAQRITVTQDDVRAIQLAKAALYAGARLLMDNLGIETVDEVRLAGAFGSHIDPMHAMVLGLIPDCDLARVSSIGNAAGTGALIALLARDARAEIEAVVRRVEKVETAVEPRFQAHFVEALAIPHKSAPATFLSQAVALPPPSVASSAREGGRRRTRPGRAAGPTPGIDTAIDIQATEPEAVPEESR
ncbi:MAG TPA: ASKHA domain-containing protein [Candidatus Limnocylindrales bacterium]|nr:ASKHA domain-containing protein [Candidatus Limnocylindrales bacterium]